MSASIQRSAARIAALAVVVGLALWLADTFAGSLAPRTQGWILVTLTAVFVISEAFFWKAIDKVTELPQSDALTAFQAKQLSDRVQTLKNRLVGRWFLLLALKAMAGGSAAWLANQTATGGPQRLLWLVGVGALVVSLPIALSFFRNWQQADAIKAKLSIEARQQKEQKSALDALSTPPAKPLNADKQLNCYTKVVGKAKRAATS